MDTTVQDWLTLHLVENLGAAGCHKLIEAFGSVTDVFKASRRDLDQVSGIRKSAKEIIVSSPPRKKAEQELEQAHRLGVSVLTLGDEFYPKLLRTIYSPPIVLYVRGDSLQLNRAAVAIVGSRAATIYGLKVAASMARDLTAQGLAIISGLALGVDAAAHAGALEGGGVTVAVLGCGVDICYPQKNQVLAEKIAATGAIVSEYSFGTKPEAFRFPARNRIISGLSLGVLVVEAAIRSGSLITARQALDQGREVFAVPGRVDSFKSAGTHRLLQEGAKLVHTVGDILEELPPLHVPENCGLCGTGKKTDLSSLGKQEEQILAVLDAYPQHFDTILSQVRLPVHKLNELLLILELQGMVECLPGQQYRAI